MGSDAVALSFSDNALRKAVVAGRFTPYISTCCDRFAVWKYRPADVVNIYVTTTTWFDRSIV